MSDLYLRTTELANPYESRRCSIIKRMRSEMRDDLALVSIEPPLPKETYNTEDSVKQVILASRLEGSTLFPMSTLPLAVYICVVIEPLDNSSDLISSEHLSIIDWGELVHGFPEKNKP
jgi:hypothetical protein